ncbi:hypothetical protein ACK32R_03650 [Aeromonas dhakensis]|uniref:hypothetical protein n=1 Tax=Aeromonas dhakensis TaxID=196024 RepID=UPI003985CF34
MASFKRRSTQPGISKNTLTPFLLKHSNPQQRARAARDTTLSLEQFTTLAADSDEHVKICLAKNAATPPLILADLACDHHFTVCFWVAMHSACPLYILKALMNDPVDVVSMAAKGNLERKS